MKSKTIKKPFSYKEAIRLYHAAQQIRQDFFGVSPHYYMGLSGNYVRKKMDDITVYIVSALRKKMLESVGVSTGDREELLQCKERIIGRIPVEEVFQIYRDILEDVGLDIVDDLTEFMELESISEYEIHPCALFGVYLLNKDVGTDIRQTLNLLETALEEQMEESIFAKCDFVDYRIRYPNYFYDEESEVVDLDIPGIAEQKKDLLRFIDEYRQCLDGAPINEHSPLGIMKRFLVSLNQYYMDNAVFLRELPGLCILLFGGIDIIFHIDKKVYMRGSAQLDIYLLKDRVLAAIISKSPHDDDVQVIKWCLDRMCESGHRAESSYLSALTGWKCTEQGILFSTVSCRDTDLAQNFHEGISLFAAVLAPLILDAVSEHVKMTYPNVSIGETQGE